MPWYFPLGKWFQPYFHIFELIAFKDKDCKISLSMSEKHPIVLSCLFPDASLVGSREYLRQEGACLLQKRNLVIIQKSPC